MKTYELLPLELATLNELMIEFGQRTNQFIVISRNENGTWQLIAPDEMDMQDVLAGLNFGMQIRRQIKDTLE